MKSIFPQIRKTFEENKGIVYTLFGRPRRLGSFLKVANKNLERDDLDCDPYEMQRKCNGYIRAAERRVASHEIQGLCGDLCRLVLIKLYDKYFNAENRDTNIDFLNAVHDEVNFYAINEHEKILKYARELEDLMYFKAPSWQFGVDTSIELGFKLGCLFPFEWIDSNRTTLIPKRVK